MIANYVAIYMITVRHYLSKRLLIISNAWVNTFWVNSCVLFVWFQLILWNIYKIRHYITLKLLMQTDNIFTISLFNSHTNFKKSWKMLNIYLDVTTFWDLTRLYNTSFLNKVSCFSHRWPRGADRRVVSLFKKRNTYAI